MELDENENGRDERVTRHIMSPGRAAQARRCAQMRYVILQVRLVSLQARRGSVTECEKGDHARDGAEKQGHPIASGG